MPYIEILAPRAAESRKREAAEAVTDGIVRSFGVTASTVTLYFLPIEAAGYAHAGEFGLPASGSRVFVKVHAYRRGTVQRRAAAEALTPAIAACFDTPALNVAIYFLDRELDEVAHEGRLASDEATETSSTP